MPSAPRADEPVRDGKRGDGGAERAQGEDGGSEGVHARESTVARAL
jgi:hypothetical protein